MKQEVQWAFNANTIETTEVEMDVKTDGSVVRCILKQMPTADQFPGGVDWTNEDGESIPNPWYEMALKYAMYYEFGTRRRNGEREFTALHRPPAGPRTAPVMKEKSAKEAMVKTLMKSRGWTEQQARERADMCFGE